MPRALSAGYAAALGEFRLEFSRAGAYACIVLVLLGIALDSALYPQRQGGFALARIAVSALVFAITLLMRGAWGKRRIQWLTFVWLLLPQIMIAAMIALTQGVASLYYVGLTLAMYPASYWPSACGKTWCLAAYPICCTWPPARVMPAASRYRPPSSSTRCFC